jgi:hypothetical protein
MVMMPLGIHLQGRPVAESEYSFSRQAMWVKSVLK